MCLSYSYEVKKIDNYLIRSLKFRVFVFPSGYVNDAKSVIVGEE